MSENKENMTFRGCFRIGSLDYNAATGASAVLEMVSEIETTGDRIDKVSTILDQTFRIPVPATDALFNGGIYDVTINAVAR